MNLLFLEEMLVSIFQNNNKIDCLSLFFFATERKKKETWKHLAQMIF